MVVLGIDPGLERMGWGCIRKSGSQLQLVECGLIQTPRVELPLRLRQIHLEALELFDRLSPDAIATERQIFAANKTTAFDVAKALGALLVAAASRSMDWSEYAPPEVKLGVVGHGAADKRQVAFMVTRILGLTEAPKPDDVTDALAIAICHALRGSLTGTIRP